MKKIDNINEENTIKNVKNIRKMTIAIHSLGCKVNQYESDAIINKFIENGYKHVEYSEKADVYLINTCSVTNVADKKSRKIINRAKKQNPKAIVVAMGCYVQVSHHNIKNNSNVDILIGNSHKDQVFEIVRDYINFDYQKKLNSHFLCDYVDNIKENSYEELENHLLQSHARAVVKIQDGCNQFCSYCIIPYTRGRIKSRKPENVIKEVKFMILEGYKEAVITGIHLGSYGVDIKNTSLIDIIEQLNNLEGLERIRLGSLEPTIITKEFIERLVECSKICPQFHLSLQSGSDTVLKRMNRRYTTKEYYESVMLLRKYFKNVNITTDVITAFPEETNEEFKETCNFIEKIGFYKVHVFKYSKRKGTKASKMMQVDSNTANKRTKELNMIVEKQYNQQLEKVIAKNEELEVLIEGVHETYSYGHTKNFNKIFVKTKNIKVKDIIKAFPKKPMKDGILAEEK